MSKTKKPHPADLADRKKIMSATHFNVHLRLAPSEKINERAATMFEAATIADRLSAKHGKPAMVYAITPDNMTTFVPADMLADAKADEAMKKPLTGREIAQLSAIITGGGYKRANSTDSWRSHHGLPNRLRHPVWNHDHASYSTLSARGS